MGNIDIKIDVLAIIGIIFIVLGMIHTNMYYIVGGFLLYICNILYNKYMEW